VVVEHEAGSLDRAEGQAQKTSGGLQAWITAKRPERRALTVAHAVAANEYAYSAMKLTLLPPGA
jgi:hypothetical protein